MRVSDSGVMYRASIASAKHTAIDPVGRLERDVVMNVMCPRSVINVKVKGTVTYLSYLRG